MSPLKEVVRLNTTSETEGEGGQKDAGIIKGEVGRQKELPTTATQCEI
jgi:hypothetical protein